MDMAGRQRTHESVSRVTAGDLGRSPLAPQMVIDNSVGAAEESSGSPLAVMRARYLTLNYAEPILALHLRRTQILFHIDNAILALRQQLEFG